MSELNTVLFDLMVEWEDRRTAGTPVTPEEICRDRPDLLDEFARLVRQVAWLDSLLAPHTEPAEPPLPVIPGFEVLDVIGEGGMGTVYRARDVSLDRVVAIKKPRASAAVSRARFDREMRALAKLRDHPHVVPIYSAGLVGDEPYFVMDYVPGSLVEHKRELVGSAERVAEFLERVARAVEYAHQAGVLHRDLKPSNILIAADGQPRVSDFGVAALLAGEPVTGTDVDTPADRGAGRETQLTRTGATAGTPAYSAPETFRRTPAQLTRAADVWSLGVILYELLVGRLPFSEPTEEHLLDAIIGQEPPRPRTVRPNVSRGLEAILMKCLSKDAAKRYSSAAALADALAAWRRWRVLWKRCACVGGALLALLLATGIVVETIRPPDLEKQHATNARRATDKLGRGEAVTLVPESGWPLSHRLRLGDGYTRMAVNPNGEFAVAAGPPALVEFLSDPGIDRYRFSAEIRQEGFLGNSIIGLYFGHQSFPIPDGMAHVFGYLRFSDYGPMAIQHRDPDGKVKSMAALDHLCLMFPAAIGRDYAACDGRNLPYEPPDQTKLPPGPWRRLVIEAEPGKVRAQFEGQPLREYPLALSQSWVDEILPKKYPALKGIPITITNRGGLGLYVAGGEARIRNCRIEPFSQPGIKGVK